MVLTSASNAVRCFRLHMDWRSMSADHIAERDHLHVRSAVKHLVTLSALSNTRRCTHRKEVSTAKYVAKLSKGRPLYPRISSSTRTQGLTHANTAGKDSTRNQT